MALKNVDAESSVSHTLFWNNGTNHAGSNVDAYTVIADPLLTTDYALQAGSPAIDAGTARYEHNGAVILDYPSSSYSGAAPDAGWQESGCSLPPTPPPTETPDCYRYLLPMIVSILK
jgi:hypothetical protein